MKLIKKTNMTGVIILVVIVVLGFLSYSYFNKLNKNNMENTTNTFEKSYDMDISSTNDDDFLKNYYHATDFFKLNKEEEIMLFDLFSKEINRSEEYGKRLDSLEYSIQYIGMIVSGKRIIYAHAWKSGYMTEGDGFDPKKHFVTSMVMDGGYSFIDAEVDIEKKEIIINAHGIA